MSASEISKQKNFKVCAIQIFSSLLLLIIIYGFAFAIVFTKIIERRFYNLWYLLSCRQLATLVYLFIVVEVSVKTNMAGVRATLWTQFVRESSGTGRSLTLCAKGCKPRRSLCCWTKFNRYGVSTGRELTKNTGKHRYSVPAWY